MKPTTLWIVLGAAFAGATLLPFVAPDYTIRTVAGLCFFMVLTSSFNLLGGQSGYLNLGQGVYVGVGAYSVGLCLQSGLPWWAALAVSVVSGSILGLLLSPLLFRLKGAAFALINLALLYLFFYLAHRLRGLTGGADGFFLGDGTNLILAYYGQLFLAAILTVIAFTLPGSRLGYQAKVLGTDAFLAETLGISTAGVKTRIFIMCAAFLSASGSFLMVGEGYLIPSTVFGLQTSLLPVAMAMVGGLGNPAGPLWGTVAVFGIQEWLWVHVGSMEQTLLGIMLIIAAKREAAKRWIGQLVNWSTG